MIVRGAAAGDRTGEYARIVGDFDGDGLADAAVTASGEVNDFDEGATLMKTVYVVRGARSFGTVSLAGGGRRVIRIRNVPTRGYETTVAPVGDVNRDGLDDLLIGTPDLPGGKGGLGGAVYVVFGSRSGRDVDLAAPGSRGWKVRGTGNELLGVVMDGVGDVNRDGFADIGLEGEVLLGGRRAPAAGKRRVAIRGTNQQRITEVTPGGDLDRDGVADFLVSNADDEAAWPVFGGPRLASSLRVATLPDFHPRSTAGLGFNNTGIGDFSGDGRPDLVFATPYDSLTVQFTAPGRARGRHLIAGLRIRAATPKSDDGTSPPDGGWTGDVNGDGRADLLVVRPRDERDNDMWVVYGRARGGTLDVASLGNAASACGEARSVDARRDERTPHGARRRPAAARSPASTRRRSSS